MHSFIDRLERMLHLLSYLQSGPMFNARQLAMELHVNRRTIYRDLNILRAINIPVSFDETRGGYCLSSDYHLPHKLGLGTEELVTLIHAAHLSLLQMIPGVSNTIRESTAKLMNSLKGDLGLEVCDLLKSCELDFRMYAKGQPHLGILLSIFEAIRKQTKIRVESTVETSKSSTKISPFRIVASSKDWWLIGRSSVHRKDLAFDIQEMKRIEILKDPFTVPVHYFNSTKWHHLLESASTAKERS